MKGIAILATIAVLGAICGMHAEETKAPRSQPDRGELLQERPNTLPDDTMREPGTTDTGRERVS